MIFMKFFCGEMVLLVMFHAPAYFVLLSNFVYRALFNSQKERLKSTGSFLERASLLQNHGWLHNQV